MKSRLLIASMLTATLVAPLTAQQTPAAKAAPPVPTVAPVSPPAPAPATAAAATAHLRRLYFQRDFEGAYAEGVGLLVRFPAEPALRAWWIMAGSAAGHATQAVAWSDSLARTFPGNYWSEFTRAYMLSGPGAQRDSAYAAAARTRALAQGQADEPWLQAIVRERLGRASDAVAVADSAIGQGHASPELLVVKGRSLGQLSRGREPKPALADSAAATLAAALKLDSTCVSAWQWAGVYGGGSAAEKYARLRRAVQLAPYSLQVHQGYWNAIRSLPDRSTTAKTAETVADADALLRARPDEPRVLTAVASEFDRMQLLERARALEDTVLARWPGSADEEEVLFSRILSSGMASDSAGRARRFALVRAYLARPVHVNANHVQSALTLFFYDDFQGVPDAELEQNAAALGPEANGQIKVRAARALADRGIALDVAEKLARQAPRQFRAMNLQRVVGPDGKPMTEGQLKGIVQRLVNDAGDALGWVLFAQGRLREADSTLSAARDSAPTALMLYHAGRLEEKRGRLAAAQAWYEKGLAREPAGVTPGAHADAENEPALHRVYLALHHSERGYAPLRDSVRAKQPKPGASAGRAVAVEKPAAVPEFKLSLLGGGTFASDSLPGKITVVDFWGTWCAPCVAEMPAFQKFWERYHADPDVRLLTIDANDDASVVRDFMNRRKFDFPVLLSDDYHTRAEVSVFPTTWVLDRQGRRVFYVLNADEKELSRLVEQLRGAPAQATTKP